MNKMTDYLSQEEIQEFKKAFSLFDKDGDGSITAFELRTVMESLDMTPKDEDLERMIREVDLDGNGDIDFEEFITMLSQMKKKSGIEEQIREAFKMFDPDDDGLIGRQQLQHVLENLGNGVRTEEISQIIDYVDTDGDGVIHYEFIISQYLNSLSPVEL